jgi:serine/threonine protein kinase
MTNGLLPSTSSLIGAVLLGRYRVVRELAKGGMGVVYLARSEGAVGFVKPVVIKLVLPEHAEDRRFLGMFAREAQILAHLRHPSIATVLEFGEQDGAYVMVLEYVRGYHLGQWTRYLRLKERQVPADVALQLTIDVLDALHHAHTMAHPDGSSMHIVHRDVSPSNILLDEEGRARLLDFGVARMRGGDVNYQTQVKGFVGKLMYSAPEVFSEGEATPSSDAYACAVVLHEMLLGRNSFRGENQARTLHNVLSMIPEGLEALRDDVPPGLDAVLKRGLAKAPADRFETARDFAAALRAIMPSPESEVRARMSALMKIDFSSEMADMLGIESLTERDAAWRRLSLIPAASEDIELLEDDIPGTVAPAATVSSGIRATRDRPLPSLPPSLPPTQFSQPPTTAQRAIFRSGTLVQPRLPDVVQAVTLPDEASTASRFHKLVPHLVWAGVALVAVAVAGWAMTLPHEASPISAVGPNVQVVQTARPEPHLEPAAGDDPPPVVIEPLPPEASSPAPRSMRAPRSAAPDAQELTRAFRRQQAPIASCFEQHALALTGVPVVTLEFTLEADGKLAQVQVQPSALGATELGQCIKRVALKTRFPAQGKGVSFAIPLSASKGAAR